ncbi:MAG: sigma-70 family RNA polymerase sigma factor [Myxococcota bacterium]
MTGTFPPGATSGPSGSAHDAAFVEALRRRESWALAQMFDRYRREVERVLIGMLGPDSEVSDVTQDVFVRAIRSVHKFRGEAPALRRWLVQIAVRAAKNRFRHLHSRPWLRSREADPREQEPQGPSVSPEVVDALHRTYAVVSTLPDAERLVFTLRVLERMALPEVADACGISVATVKRRVAKATKKFEQRAARDPVLRAWIEGRPA